MQKNLFPTILISALLAVTALIFGWNYSQATIVGKSNSSNTLLNGLVAWWTFDGQDMTAVTTTDKSKNGNDGTRRFGVGVATGKIGQAMKFDGVDDAVYDPITSTISFVAGSSFTLSSWVKTATGTAQRLIARYEGTPYYNISIGGDCTANKACLAIRGSGGGEPIAKSTSNVNDNKWHLITGVRDVVADKIYLYFDGVREATLADSSVGDFGTSYGVTLGCHATINCSGLWLNGLMDDARIYNRALSGAEVVELYKQGGGKINKTDLTRAQLRNGLVGHWTMDGPDVTVNTTTDKSGNGNNGTRNGGTRMLRGKIGQAIRFDGSTAFVAVSDAPFDITSNLTIGSWVKLLGSGQTQIITWKTNAYGLVYNYNGVAGCNLSQICFALNSGAGWTAISSNETAVLNKWYYVAAVFNDPADTMTLYIDGVQKNQASYTSSIVTTDYNFHLGNYDFSPDAGYLDGFLDDVRVYNRALSPAEIQQLYKQGGGKINKTDLTKPNLRSNLAGHWTFDGPDVTTNTTTDRSGSGKNGTRTGTRAIRGKIGQSLNFNGSSDYIEAGSTSDFDITSNVTMAAWVKSPSGSSWRGIFSKSQNNASPILYSFDISNTDKLRFYVRHNTGSNDPAPSVTSNGTVADNSWHHVAVSYNPTTGNATLYIDGKYDNSATLTTGNIVSSDRTFQIGDLYYSSRIQYFNGTMDDVRFYNRALSPAEVVQLYRMGK